MKKGLYWTLVFFLILLMASPAAASVQLNVNGRNYDSSNQASIQGSSTMAPLDVLADTLGCTVTQNGNQLTVQENQDVLKMSVGSLTAVLNGQDKAMPVAPLLKDGKVYVPVRFIYEAFGADVSWVQANKTVSVSYPEKRSGMTAEELMTKASQKMSEANRYKMTADAKIAMNGNAGTPAAQTGTENMSMNMETRIEAWVQANPILMYMKQDAKVVPADSSQQSTPDIKTEMVFNESGMYVTMPDVGWVKMNLPGLNIQELMKQSNSQDPAAVMKQMKDLGMSLSFANDQERNGQKYWVIDAAMGGALFKSDYFKQVAKSSGMDQNQDMQKMFEGMDADIKYSTWINQNTLYTDYMNMDSRIKMKMDAPVTVQSGPINMDMNMQADYALSDYGVSFSVPDVSKAADFESVMKKPQ